MHDLATLIRLNKEAAEREAAEREDLAQESARNKAYEALVTETPHLDQLKVAYVEGFEAGRKAERDDVIGALLAIIKKR